MRMLTPSPLWVCTIQSLAPVVKGVYIDGNLGPLSQHRGIVEPLLDACGLLHHEVSAVGSEVASLNGVGLVHVDNDKVNASARVLQYAISDNLRN